MKAQATKRQATSDKRLGVMACDGTAGLSPDDGSPARSSLIAHRSPGFTLVELLVVMAIIALLLGILIIGVGKARASAEKAATQQYMGTIALALGTYEHDFNAYPPSVPPSGPFCGVSSVAGWKGSELLAQALVGPDNSDGNTGPGWKQTTKVYGPYLNTGEHGIMDSPITSGAYVLNDAWDQPIAYYRANRDAPAANLWGNAGWRFNRGDNDISKSPVISPADDATLSSARFLLFSIGADAAASTGAGDKSKDNDNVVVTGP